MLLLIKIEAVLWPWHQDAPPDISGFACSQRKLSFINEKKKKRRRVIPYSCGFFRSRIIFRLTSTLPSSLRFLHSPLIFLAFLVIGISYFFPSVAVFPLSESSLITVAWTTWTASRLPAGMMMTSARPAAPWAGGAAWDR